MGRCLHCVVIAGSRLAPPPGSVAEVLMAAKDELGRRGEDLAAAHLSDKGLTIVERNWRCSLGEIDVVARDGATVVFVEVKTRSTALFGHPLEAITPVKLARLRRLAGAWCEAHPEGGEPGRRPHIRIDAIAIIAPTGAEPVVDHLEGVF